MNDVPNIDQVGSAKRPNIKNIQGSEGVRGRRVRWTKKGVGWRRDELDRGGEG